MSKKKSSKSTKLKITRPKVEREDEELDDQQEGEHEEEQDEEEEHDGEEEQDEEQPEEPAPSAKLPGADDPLEEWERQLMHRLQFIADYKEVTVPQFAAFSGLGDDTRRVLDSYVTQDLIERVWRQAAGRYVLAEGGVTLLAQLGARDKHRAKKHH